MATAKVTERSFYDGLINIIRAKGGEGVQEVLFNSVPDVIFSIKKTKWILSVKLGDDPKTIKDAFLQYLRHKQETDIEYGILLLLPDSLRKTPATEDAIRVALGDSTVTALVDADIVKEELRQLTFPRIIDFISDDVLPRLQRRQHSYYSLPFVISVLREQVEEMMSEIALTESSLMRIITDRKLLMDLGHLEPHNAEAVAHFLASYIFLSQILFLRLLVKAQEGLIPITTPVTHHTLRHAFSKVLEINYRPIYEVDVLDVISDKYVKDTFDLIWGLQIERVRYELPGRLFHALMPPDIRKMLAAFYTRPLAADLLAYLTISSSTESVCDPACGSGTILTSAYRRKEELHKQEGKAGIPHKRFCEHDIYGADIMPFAVHLASANLAAMHPEITIQKNQIIHGDSLRFNLDTPYKPGLQMGLFAEPTRAKLAKGDAYDVELHPVDVVLMNPPFTKVERGISRFVNMDRFASICGGEVGLWGHFVVLADLFLKKEGIYGAVIPINVLRGRESEKVRNILFKEWTPLYILKPTRNYGFSEWAEYRDVLFIARKDRPQPSQKVKFGLVKKDLTTLSDKEILTIAQKLESHDRLRSDHLIDIDSHSLKEIVDRFDNLMWFCGVTEFGHRDIIVKFVNETSDKLNPFPPEYFREGFRPVPKGVSKFLFLTRGSNDARTEEAFLRFKAEAKTTVSAESPLKATYKFRLSDITPTLRTSVGLQSMDISSDYDYIAHTPYDELSRVCRAADQTVPKGPFWAQVQKDLLRVRTNLVVSHRINPFSPSTYLNAFFTNTLISPSNQLNVVAERDPRKAKAVCVVLNSILFFAQFLLLKEESTGRYINIRFYDLYQMNLYPSDRFIHRLNEVYKKYHKISFPSLRHQFDQDFDQRYQEFWEIETGMLQQKFWSVIDKPVRPFKDRLSFDLAVCKALGLKVTKKDILDLYEVITKEMIIIRALTKD